MKHMSDGLSSVELAERLQHSASRLVADAQVVSAARNPGQPYQSPEICAVTEAAAVYLTALGEAVKHMYRSLPPGEAERLKRAVTAMRFASGELMAIHRSLA